LVIRSCFAKTPAGATHLRLLAAVYALAALAFSARAAVMILGFTAALLFLIWRERNVRLFLALAGVALGAALAFGAAVVADPDYWSVVGHAAFLEPRSMMPELSYSTRLFVPQRATMLAIMLAALLFQVGLFIRNRACDTHVVSAIAIMVQLVLVLVDPSPGEYAYGYALIPVMFGLSQLHAWRELFRFNSERLLPLATLTITLGLTGLCLAYPLLKGKLPPAGSVLRMSIDRPLDQQAIDRIDDVTLVGMMVSRNRHNLTDELRIRSAVCARFRGTVVAVFPSHPICKFDPAPAWHHLLWPPFPDEKRDTTAAEQRAATALFSGALPDLVIWGMQFRDHMPAPDWLLKRLGDCYEMHAGFALRRETCGGLPQAEPPSAALLGNRQGKAADLSG